jgi:uncharacterized protein YdaT
MNKKVHHVFPHQGGGWSVRRSDTARASRIFSNKNDAIEYARKLAQKDHSDLFVHNKDGTISQKNSYGPDTYPSMN